MEKRHRPSIFWALIFISVGVVLLLNALQVLPGNVVELLIKLWPLFFIAGSLDAIIQGRGWIGAVIGLGLGTIFLLANFGYLEWSSLGLLLRLWPLLLIAWGLDLIFQDRPPAVTIVGVLIGLAVMAAVAWYALSTLPTNRTALDSVPVTQPLNGITRASVQIEDPVGRLEIAAGAADDLLVEGTVDHFAGTTLKNQYDANGGKGTLNMSLSGSGWQPWTPGFKEPLWQVMLNGNLPVDLASETAVGSLALDLTGLDIDQLKGMVAVGSLELILDSQDQLQGTVSNPVGKIKILIPEGLLVEITLDTAISTLSMPDDYLKIDRRVYSPNATAGNAEVRLKIEQPIGLVLLEAVK